MAAYDDMRRGRGSNPGKSGYVPSTRASHVGLASAHSRGVGEDLDPPRSNGRVRGTTVIKTTGR